MTQAPGDTHLPPALFLMGPTASGKTDLAMALAERLPCELVSVDSAMVYRGMDIGTAKPSPEELQAFPHRLIDLRDPSEPYSVADFRRDALEAMAEISARGKVPLLVGGSMLYFKALRDGLASLPSACETIRQQLTDRAALEGWASLHRELQRVDPQSAQRIKSTDTQRLQRALEVFQTTGKPISEWHRQHSSETPPYQIMALAIAPESRAELHRRIEQRFNIMLEEGLVGEVRGLYARGDLSVDLPSIRAVGYRQVWQYLEGQTTFDEMTEKGVAATRQLAKRQLTWLRRWSGVTWLNSNSDTLINDACFVCSRAANGCI